MSKLIPQVREEIWKKVKKVEKSDPKFDKVKKVKKMDPFVCIFYVFSVKTYVFCGYAPSGCALRCILRVHLRGAPLRGALGRAPFPFSRLEILKKFTGKSVLEKCTLFFWKKYFFGIKTL